MNSPKHLQHNHSNHGKLRLPLLAELGADLLDSGRLKNRLEYCHREFFVVRAALGGGAEADRTQLEKYLKLDQRDKIIAEYVWIDASGGVRSKCKVSLTPSLDTWTASKEGISASHFLSS